MEVEDLVWTGDESRGRRTPGGRIRKANRIRGGRGRGRGAVYASEEEINCTTCKRCESSRASSATSVVVAHCVYSLQLQL